MIGTARPGKKKKLVKVESSYPAEPIQETDELSEHREKVSRCWN